MKITSKASKKKQNLHKIAQFVPQTSEIHEFSAKFVTKNYAQNVKEFTESFQNQH
jgi:hypothetical protein